MRAGTITYRRADKRAALEVEWRGPGSPFRGRGTIDGEPALWLAGTLAGLLESCAHQGCDALAGTAEYGPDDPATIAPLIASMFGIAGTDDELQ